MGRAQEYLTLNCSFALYFQFVFRNSNPKGSFLTIQKKGSFPFNPSSLAHTHTLFLELNLISFFLNLTRPDILIGLLAQSSLPSSKFQQKDLCSPKFESSETKHQSDSPLPAGGRFTWTLRINLRLHACVPACCWHSPRWSPLLPPSLLSVFVVTVLVGPWGGGPIIVHVAAQYGVTILMPVLRSEERTTAAAMASKRS